MQGRLIFYLLICNQRWFCEKCCHMILAKWSIWVCIWRSCQNNKFSSILTGMLVNRKMIFTQKWFFMSIEYCIIHIWILFLYKSENMAIKIALVMEKEKLVNFLPYLGLGFIWSNETVRYRYFQMLEFFGTDSFWSLGKYFFVSVGPFLVSIFKNGILFIRHIK